MEMLQNLFAKKREPETSLVNTCEPFIKINHGQLEHVGFKDICDKNIRVISILGKARMGKSSFLNCLITHLSNEAYVFPTQDNDEHCTFGIDAHYLKEKNLIILDCQGVEHDDSSNDSKLLMFIYLVSDIIIFNERNMLSNSTLQSFQSMLTFMTYLELESVKKPHLIFRISDVDLQLNAKSNLEKMLTGKEDQYQNIRESILEMFNAPTALMTASLDRNEKSALKNHEYQKVLSNSENGFADAISKIGKLLEGVKDSRADVWFTMVEKMIEKINANEKIDFKKLDLYEQLNSREILEWKDKNVDVIYLSPITVDGSQKAYEENVEPRLLIKRRILTDFTKKFKSINESIKGKYYKDLQLKLSKPIDTAKEESEIKAMSILSKAYSEFNISKFKFDFKESDSIEQSAWYKLAITHFEDLDRKVEGIYYSVKEKYLDWKEKQLAYILNTSLEMKKTLNKQKTLLEGFAADLVSKIGAAAFQVIKRDRTKQELDDELTIPVEAFWKKEMQAIFTQIIAKISGYITQNNMKLWAGHIYTTEEHNIKIDWAATDKFVDLPIIYDHYEKLLKDEKMLGQYLGKRRQLINLHFMRIRKFDAERMQLWDKIRESNPTIKFIDACKIVERSDYKPSNSSTQNTKLWKKGLPCSNYVPEDVFNKTWRPIIRSSLQEMVNKKLFENLGNSWSYYYNSLPHIILTGGGSYLHIASNTVFWNYFTESLLRYECMRRSEKA